MTVTCMLQAAAADTVVLYKALPAFFTRSVAWSALGSQLQGRAGGKQAAIGFIRPQLP